MPVPSAAISAMFVIFIILILLGIRNTMRAHKRVSSVFPLSFESVDNLFGGFEDSLGYGYAHQLLGSCNLKSCVPDGRSNRPIQLYSAAPWSSGMAARARTHHDHASTRFDGPSGDGAHRSHAALQSRLRLLQRIRQDV